MEETIGKLWHRLITRSAEARHPQAAVRLKDMERTAGVLFRAFGGDAGLRVAASTIDRHRARRSLLARVAGVGDQVAQARMDETTLRLPPEIDLFADTALNRDLYLWLAALAAAHGRLQHAPPADPGTADLLRNQLATQYALQRWPGLRGRYRRLVTACLPLRPPPDTLPPAEQARERAIRQALIEPGSVSPENLSATALSVAASRTPSRTPSLPDPHPVPLWLCGAPHLSHAARRDGDPEPAETPPAAPSEPPTERRAYRAQREQMPKEKNGLSLIFRAESLMAVAEFLRINRPTDDEPDANAADAARDLDQLALAQDRDPVASRVRFDLDLPSAAADDIVLGPGLPLPEWDYRKQTLVEDHVRLIEMTPRDATPGPLPPALCRTARRLHQQFSALRPGRSWLRHRTDGSELDLDEAVRAHTDRACGHRPSDALYRALERRERDLACLVLADLSLSTDTWVSSEQRVIDVIRDALLLFGEALGATGDRFAMCGFSSVRRANVRFHHLKGFDERFDDTVRGRIAAIRPGYYTRLGAGIRRAAQLLATQPASRRMLLILSDGKPNDLDLYEGRYGIEDSRAAIREARSSGLIPFCATIDREAESYLPHLFGANGFAMIRRPEDLPAHLPQLYAQLTR